MASYIVNNRGMKRANEHLQDKRIEKKPCIDGKNKGIKQGNEHQPYERSSDASEENEKSSSMKFRESLTKVHHPNCDDVTKFDRLAKIGQGTFGEVFKVRDKVTKRVFAIKKILNENELGGFPITAVREIKILQVLKHRNIVDFIEVVRSKPSNYNRYKPTFYLVFEFCEHDLAGLLSSTQVTFSLGEIKMVLKQLFDGLYFMHSSNILHRDIKSSNILITKMGILKIADFGLARSYSTCNTRKSNNLTNRVVTLWYRPPELLLGERNYGPAIDIWGAGCIMAEMWTRTPIFQGKEEHEQLVKIVKLCGSITPEVYKDVEKLQLYNEIVLPKDENRRVKERLKGYVKDVHGLDLIDKLLTLDPAKRIDSDAALMHDFFWNNPTPCPLERMLQSHTRSMFEYLRMEGKGNEKHQGAGPCHRPNPAANDGQYQDRVF